MEVGDLFYRLSILKYSKLVKILMLAMLTVFLINLQNTAAYAKKIKPKVILYVPHDDRPISAQQTAAVAQKAGVVVKMPPDNLLGNRTRPGNPESLYQWVMSNAKGADAAVISSDALLYGSLVASRKHNFSKSNVLERADHFTSIHKTYPKLPLYVFSSVMRTPKTAAASGTEEPDYYQTYGDNIFQYTALLDKDVSQGLSENEENKMIELRVNIPSIALNDWLNRRRINLSANKSLIELTRHGIINYLVIGCDDNAPFSQTHRESVILQEAGVGLPNDKFCIVAGVDEMGLLLMTRAINNFYAKKPIVAIAYANGFGGATIPSYSSEPIDNSVRAEIYLAGGRPSSSAQGADMILLINTNVSGSTYEAVENVNSIYQRANTESFVDMINSYLQAGVPVAVGDIAFANGSDNALMHMLLTRNLLFRINSYAGWNTATNSTGWAVGEGLLSLFMNKNNKNQLLLTRYTDDWVYQANVRQKIGRLLNIFPGRGTRLSLGDKMLPAQLDAAEAMQEFFNENLPTWHIKSVKVTFPWDRLFESNIQLSNNADAFTKRYFKNYK